MELRALTTEEIIAGLLSDDTKIDIEFSEKYNRFRKMANGWKELHKAKEIMDNWLTKRLAFLGDKWSTTCFHCLEVTANKDILFLQNFCGIQIMLHSLCKSKKISEAKDHKELENGTTEHTN